MMLIEERDIQKYAAYLARRQSWALKYRQDMDLDDLESMAALGILEAIKEYGTETGRWKYVAPLKFKVELRREMHLYERQRERFLIESSAGKVELDAPAGEDEDGCTQHELIEDPALVPADTVMAGKQLQDDLAAALDHLDDDLAQQAVILCYLHDMPVMELAGHMRITPKDAKCAIRRGLAKLRKDKALREAYDVGLDEITPWFMAAGARDYTVTGLSAVEKIVMWREGKRS